MTLSEAAACLRRGGIVAFPTETVYGLGANALDATAVARIYAAKGRPSTSPLIVHVADVAMARSLALVWPEAAERLAQRFWPGPLTLVLPKQPHVPEIVTAGLPNVGLRMPSHPVALALLRETGLPLAAPSANRFTQLSPVTAQHVRESLGAAIDGVVEGEPATVGIESTIVSLVGAQPVLLRPGVITAGELEEVIGPLALPEWMPAAGEAHAAPGQHRKHYSPRTPLYLIGPDQPLPAGSGMYVWHTTPRPAPFQRQLPREPRAMAALLYSVLHELDAENYAWLAIEPVPLDAAWAGVADRLQRAATQG